MTSALSVHVVSGVLFGCATTAVGAVLLRRALSAGKTPDLALALALLLQALAWAAAIGVLALVPDPTATQRIALHGADMLSVAGHVALLYFVRSVFRPYSRAAGLFTWTVGACLLVVPLVNATAFADRLITPLFWPEYGLKTVGFVWATGEAARYRRKMVRRVRYGLADPVVSNRFLLWSFVTGGTALLETAVACAFAWPDASWTQGLASATTFVASPLAVILLLTFHPPQWYVRALVLRAPTVEGTP